MVGDPNILIFFIADRQVSTNMGHSAEKYSNSIWHSISNWIDVLKNIALAMVVGQFKSSMANTIMNWPESNIKTN